MAHQNLITAPAARPTEFKLVFTGISLLIDDKAKFREGVKVRASLRFSLYSAPTLAKPLKYIDFRPWTSLEAAPWSPVTAATVVSIFALVNKLPKIPTAGTILNPFFAILYFITSGTPRYFKVFLDERAIILSP